MKRKLLLAAANCLTIIAIVVAIAAMVTVATTKPGHAPSLMGYSLLRVVSGSMEPAISEGSLTIVRLTPAHEIEADDIISFYSRDAQIYGRINTHRVLEIIDVDGKLTFVTKGDANTRPDAIKTAAADVIGKVVYTSHTLGQIVGIMQNKYVFFGIILTPLIFIFIFSVRKVVRVAKDEIRQVEKEAAEEISSQQNRGCDDDDSR